MDILTSGLAMYITMCLLVTLSAMASKEEFIEKPETVYIEDGAASAELSCGEVPQSVLAIEWFIKESDEWRKVLKFYHTTTGSPRYFNDSAKYDISESVNTSLLVKNIKPSDSALFKCGSIGNSTYERYIKLQVVDQPEVSVDNSTEPVVEYTTRNLTCSINSGDQSDPFSYHYEWMYRPTYRVSDKDIPPPNGSSLMDEGKTLQLADLSYEDMAGTYKCTVTVVGHDVRSTGSSTLDVYYAAKLKSTLEDLTVYTALDSSADLTVKFRINPVNNFIVSWSMDNSTVQNSDVSNSKKGGHVQTTYSISDVTKLHLGNYTVQVINQAIKSEPNEADFFVELEMRGEIKRPFGNSSSMTVAVCLVVMFLVIAAVITVVVYILRKRKQRLQDDSKARVKVVNEYNAVPTVSHLDQNEADNRPQPKTKKYSVVHDPQIANDTPSYALPNQTTNKTQNGTQAQGSKGKSLTVKGKKSRPKPPGDPAPPPPGSDDHSGESNENVELDNKPIAEEEQQMVYVNDNDAQKQDNHPPTNDPTLMYADLTFQHIDPARQQAMPNTDNKLTYASVDFDLTKVYIVEEDTE